MRLSRRMLVRRILFFVFSVTVGTIFVKAYRAITSPAQGGTVRSAASTTGSKPPGSLPAIQKPFRFGKTGLYGVDAKRKKLVFDRNGRFKVLSFSDMHFGERESDMTYAAWGTKNDELTMKAHTTMLDLEKPDYVVFNGDLVTGELLLKENATSYLDLCFKPTVARGIPFSSTYGTHDNSFNITHAQLIDYERRKYGGKKKNSLSYTRSDAGPWPWGHGNYWVPVYAREKDTIPALIMWFFDPADFFAGARAPPHDAKGCWVDPFGVPPYIRGQRKLMEKYWGEVPPSLGFVHVAVGKARELAKLPGLKGTRDDDPEPGVQGLLNGRESGRDLPFFEALVDLDGGKGRLMALTSGHAHGNSWCAKNEIASNITMCFQGHSGYGGYSTKNTKVRNGRVFELDLRQLRAVHPGTKTWNIYENGTAAGIESLGSDFYTP